MPCQGCPVAAAGWDKLAPLPPGTTGCTRDPLAAGSWQKQYKESCCPLLHAAATRMPAPGHSLGAAAGAESSATGKHTRGAAKVTGHKAFPKGAGAARHGWCGRRADRYSQGCPTRQL